MIPSSPWVASSFDDIAECPTSQKLPLRSSSQKRPRSENRLPSSLKSFSEKRHEKKSDIPWAERFSPIAKKDLAVHKKKVEQVECWLKENIRHCIDHTRQSGSGAPLLLLTGPAGAGKTAAILALAGEMGLEVQEWLNPLQFPRQDSTQQEMGFETSENQISVFRSFLLRANKYSSLFSGSSQGKIILIEDFPNVFLKDASSFHEILGKYKKTGRCPAVFIVTDSSSGESFEHLLFPKDVQGQLEICNISFNPVAPTMLMKALTKMSAEMQMELRGERPSKTDLENIAASSKGDIRSAINALQYVSCSRKKKLYCKQPRKRQKCNDEESELVSGRDTSLFLFHALGKVLYCKRDIDKVDDSSQKLPPHLQHLERVPLIEDPEEIFKKTTISAEGFNLFLQHNYLSFVDDIEVATSCSSWLSEADILTSDWRVLGSFDDYAASLAVRGLMFNLPPYSNRASRTWKSMQKSPWHAARKTYNILSSAVMMAFKSQRLNLTEVQTELIPFLSKIKVPLQSEQRRLVDQIGTLGKQRHTFSNRPESLSEKDVYIADEDFDYASHSSVAAASLCTNSIVDVENDEEIIIEEYDEC